jgi:hypothetical protein
LLLQAVSAAISNNDSSRNVFGLGFRIVGYLVNVLCELAL